MARCSIIHTHNPIRDLCHKPDRHAHWLQCASASWRSQKRIRLFQFQIDFAVLRLPSLLAVAADELAHSVYEKAGDAKQQQPDHHCSTSAHTRIRKKGEEDNRLFSGRDRDNCFTRSHRQTDTHTHARTDSAGWRRPTHLRSQNSSRLCSHPRATPRVMHRLFLPAHVLPTRGGA
jgi:hypothetical protein